MGNPRKANGARRRHVVRWLRSQGRPCWICGLPIDYGVPPGNPGAFECDELVPVSRGGSPVRARETAAANDLMVGDAPRRSTPRGSFDGWWQATIPRQGRNTPEYAFLQKSSQNRS